MDLYTIFHTALVFWIVLDSVGSVPIFVSLLKHFEPKVQRKIIFREMIIALAVMVLFFFFGEAFFKIMGISKSSLQIAGGIILLLISIQMIFAIPQQEKKTKEIPKEPIIVPLAVPSIAGPGMLTMISLYGGGLDANKPAVLISLGIAWVLSIPALLMGTYLKKILGDNGLLAIEQLFGYVIILIAVHVISNGLFSIFNLNAT